MEAPFACCRKVKSRPTRVRGGRQVAPHPFAYEDCNFKVQKSKESTARVVVFREFNLVNSFTLEASFAGPSMGDDEGFHYGSQRLQDMGVAFCQGLLEYCDPDPVGPSRVHRGVAAPESRVASREPGGNHITCGLLDGVRLVTEPHARAAARDRGAVRPAPEGVRGHPQHDGDGGGGGAVRGGGG